VRIEKLDASLGHLSRRITDIENLNKTSATHGSSTESTVRAQSQQHPRPAMTGSYIPVIHIHVAPGEPPPAHFLAAASAPRAGGARHAPLLPRDRLACGKPEAIAEPMLGPVTVSQIAQVLPTGKPSDVVNVTKGQTLRVAPACNGRTCLAESNQHLCLFASSSGRAKI
jgi:hypothetical protein